MFRKTAEIRKQFVNDGILLEFILPYRDVLKCVRCLESLLPVLTANGHTELYYYEKPHMEGHIVVVENIEHLRLTDAEKIAHKDALISLVKKSVPNVRIQDASISSANVNGFNGYRGMVRLNF